MHMQFNYGTHSINVNCTALLRSAFAYLVVTASSISIPFDMATVSVGWMTTILNLAFIAGSSNIGIIRLPSVGSICVTATHL